MAERTTTRQGKPRPAGWGRRGVVAVEYVFLVAFVAIPAVLGIGFGGWMLLTSYTTQKFLVLAPFP